MVCDARFRRKANLRYGQTEHVQTADRTRRIRNHIRLSQTTQRLILGLAALALERMPVGILLSHAEI